MVRVLLRSRDDVRASFWGCLISLRVDLMAVDQSEALQIARPYPLTIIFRSARGILVPGQSQCVRCDSNRLSEGVRL